MSTLPLLLTLADELDSLSDRFYNDFGLGYYPHRHQYSPSSLRLIIPRLNAIQEARSGDRQLSKSPIGKDGFQVCMDVGQFKPNELTVKTVDNCVVVEGKHEERQDDHGFISRHFTRRYVLPNGYDAKQAVSTLSSDGVLTVKVPPPQKQESNERIIQIQQTGPAHLSVKENKEEDKSAEQKK